MAERSFKAEVEHLRLGEGEAHGAREICSVSAEIAQDEQL